MLNFVVRCWLVQYHDRSEEFGDLRHIPLSGPPRQYKDFSYRTLHSTIECRGLVDANEVAKSLAGVRETEVCVVFLVAGKHEQPKRVIIPIAELDRVHHELYNHEDEFEPKSLDELEVKEALIARSRS